MRFLSRTSGLSICVIAWLAACGGAPKQAPAEPSRGHSAPVIGSTPASQSAPGGLYSAAEALSDTLSSPLEYVGSGSWPEVERLQACVFKNQRVIVVNAYCTVTESSAFRIDVYSPTRGHVRIYAEGKGPVSAQMRQSYFTFKAVSEELPGPTLAIAPLSLGMSFPELRAYDQKRYDAFLPACYGGTELNVPRSGCLGPLAPHASAWEAQHRVFLSRANDDWYRVLRELRVLASQYGKDIEQEEDF